MGRGLSCSVRMAPSTSTPPINPCNLADIAQGLVKPVFFGFIIATIGCFYGMNTKGGTQGVGRSTTQAVVVSSVLIIVSDFVISRFMIGIFGR